MWRRVAFFINLLMVVKFLFLCMFFILYVGIFHLIRKKTMISSSKCLFQLPHLSYHICVYYICSISNIKCSAVAHWLTSSKHQWNHICSIFPPYESTNNRVWVFFCLSKYKIGGLLVINMILLDSKVILICFFFSAYGYTAIWEPTTQGREWSAH